MCISKDCNVLIATTVISQSFRKTHNATVKLSKCTSHQFNNVILSSSANCCRSFNISTTPINPGFREGGQYFPYEIETEDGCPTPLNESAHLKVLSEYRTFDQIYCLILYTCRPSRQGLHAFCSTPHINRVLRLMIDYEFRKYGQPQYNVKHNTDYRSGKCFPNGISREQDNIYQ